MAAKTNNDRHTSILDAAQKRFAQYGPHKVTMDEIATDLGISKAALYYYFTTKEDVYKQVIAREQQEFIHHIEAISKEQCPSSLKIQHYFDCHLELISELLDLKILSYRAC